MSFQCPFDIDLQPLTKATRIISVGQLIVEARFSINDGQTGHSYRDRNEASPSDVSKTAVAMAMCDLARTP